MTAFPLVLHLPEGMALYVAGSGLDGCPRYERDGVDAGVDIRIPEDLGPSWHWFGSYLCQHPEHGHAALSTLIHGLPGIFDAARKIEALRAPRAPAEPTQMVMWG
jgi:hypothetical protein